MDETESASAVVIHYNVRAETMGTQVRYGVGRVYATDELIADEDQACTITGENYASLEELVRGIVDSAAPALMHSRGGQLVITSQAFSPDYYSSLESMVDETGHGFMKFSVQAGPSGGSPIADSYMDRPLSAAEFETLYPMLRAQWEARCRLLESRDKA